MSDEKNASVEAPLRSLSVSDVAALFNDAPDSAPVDAPVQSPESNHQTPNTTGDAPARDEAEAQAAEAEAGDPIATNADGAAGADQPEAGNGQQETEDGGQTAETPEAESQEAEEQPAEADAPATEAEGEAGFKPIQSQAELDKLIGKRIESARKKAEEAVAKELTELRQQLEEARTVAPAVPSDVPALATVTSEADLNKLEQTQRNIKNAAETFLDDFLVDQQGVMDRLRQANVKVTNEAGQEIPADDWTPEVVGRYLTRAKREAAKMVEQIPVRRERLRYEREVTAEVAKDIPWIAQKTSKEYGHVANLRKQHPWINQAPAPDAASVVMLLGLNVLSQMRAAREGKAPATTTATATANAAAPKKIVPPVSSPKRTITPPKPGAGKVRTAASKKFEQTGSREDLVAAFAEEGI